MPSFIIMLVPVASAIVSVYLIAVFVWMMKNLRPVPSPSAAHAAAPAARVTYGHDIERYTQRKDFLRVP